jgi:hypothetical protein
MIQADYIQSASLREIALIHLREIASSANWAPINRFRGVRFLLIHHLLVILDTSRRAVSIYMPEIRKS